MALSTSDLEVSPSMGNTGGAFFACNRGMGGGIGDLFSFSYPTNFLGIRQNNTHFFTSCGRIELLYHTTQAALDPFPIFAYVNLDTVRDFMLSGSFFTGFTPDSANIWRFTYPDTIRGIVSPRDGEFFQVGDILTVKVAIQDTFTASLIINGQNIETKADLGGQNEVIFEEYTLTDSHVGSVSIVVEARNRGGTLVTLPTVRINVAIPEVAIFSPRNGDIYMAGDELKVGAVVQAATRTELEIGTHRQSVVHSAELRTVNFEPHTFTPDDVGDIDVTVTAYDNHGISASAIVQLQVARNPRADFLIAIDPGHYIGRNGNRIPQMPDVSQIGAELNWDWSNVTSRLATEATPPATAPHTIPTPDGTANIITPAGAVTPSGWNVSTERDDPAFRTPERPYFPSIQARERTQMREWEFNNAVTKHLISMLERKGYSVFNVAPEDDPRMSGKAPRDDDNGIGVNQRVERVNYEGADRIFNPFGRAADFCLSIHANAHILPANWFSGDAAVSSASGYETLYQPSSRPTSTTSRVYADIVRKSLIAIATTYGQRERSNRIYESTAHALLNRGRMPVVLPECGFMTNFHDAILLMDDEYRLRIAEALSTAIDEIYEHWRSNQ